MRSMTTEATIATLYRQACADDAAVLAGIDARDLADLAQGRLAGERRQRLVEAIAVSPALAAAWRLARAGGDWSQALAADMAAAANERRGAGSVAPARRQAVAQRRRFPFAVAAAVSAMAVGAVLVSQGLRERAGAESELAAQVPNAASDDILATSFGRNGDHDTIFSSRSGDSQDQIFAFGKDS
jgi:hypothetical protein